MGSYGLGSSMPAWHHFDGRKAVNLIVWLSSNDFERVLAEN